MEEFYAFQIQNMEQKKKPKKNYVVGMSVFHPILGSWFLQDSR